MTGRDGGVRVGYSNILQVTHHHPIGHTQTHSLYYHVDRVCVCIYRHYYLQHPSVRNDGGGDVDDPNPKQTKHNHSSHCSRCDRARACIRYLCPLHIMYRVVHRTYLRFFVWSWICSNSDRLHFEIYSMKIYLYIFRIVEIFVLSHFKRVYPAVAPRTSVKPQRVVSQLNSEQCVPRRGDGPASYMIVCLTLRKKPFRGGV